MATSNTVFGTVTLTPAQKAVQTRRRNAIARARKDAANKAWATRRQNTARAIIAEMVK